MNTPQLRLRKREIVEVSDYNLTQHRYGFVAGGNSSGGIVYYLEDGLQKSVINYLDMSIIVVAYPLESLTLEQRQLVSELEDKLNVWYQYTSESPFDNVTIEGPTIAVETVENITTYHTEHIVSVVRHIGSLTTTLALTNGDRVELMLRDETHKSIVATVSGQIEPQILNI